MTLLLTSFVLCMKYIYFLCYDLYNNFQALLAHSVGMFAERNKFAYEFRILDEEYQTDDSNLNFSH